MKRAFLFIAAIAMLLLDTSPLWTQGEPISLQEIWRREENGMTFERVCKPGRIVKMGLIKDSDIYIYLIDLRTGETIYKTDPQIDGYVLEFNYFGDRYYLLDQITKELKEYDVKTKEFKRIVKGIISSSDSSLVGFNYTSHSLMFRNGNTGVLLDSFKIPNTPNTPLFHVSSTGYEFSIDSRYFLFGLYDPLNSSTSYYYIYDRQRREIIWQKTLYEHESLRYQFFNTSNKIAFAEEVQLPGDDKVYSYIRIFDPDTRTIEKNIKISEYPNLTFVINADDTKLIFRVSDPNQKNVNQVYNLKDDRFESLRFRVSAFLADTNALYSWTGLALIAYKFDWTVGVTDATPQEANIIYPNPTNGMVSINITPEFVLGIWNVSDLQGRILKKGLIGHANKLDINISDLIPGTYYLTLTNKDSKSSYKLIKQ